MLRCANRRKRAIWIRSCLAAAPLLAGSVSHAAISIVQNSSTSWTIANGDLTVTFDPASNNIKTLSINGSANVLDPKKSEIYPELTGTPFGSGTQTSGFQEAADGSYIDFWNTTTSTGTSTNPLTYSFHYVMYNNDPNISAYEVVSHSATDPATNALVQGQFLARVDPTQFYNSYQMNVSVNNIGAQTSVIQNPYNFPTQTGRTVQDSTTDLSGSGIPGNWGSNVYTKYDYSSYTQFLQANTEYGPNYSVSTIFTSPDTMNGGPTKQNLQYTNNIAMIEFLSAHYGDANFAYIPQQGVATSKLYGPYDFSFNPVAGQTGAQLEQAAVNSIPALDADYNADAELISNGYIPTTTTSRGSIAVNATSTAGWNSNVNFNTVVFSDPHRSMQDSVNGYQYWAQLSTSGAATISNVVPGMYRATLYQLGQWGETRVDGVSTTAGAVATQENLKFIPENFSTAAPIWTIGTPDRSAHEFLNGSATAANPGVVLGGDLRQYYGDYDFWAEEQTLGNPGHVVYYATAVGATAATNNPLKWIANQWQKFNPGLYDSSNNTTDEYSKIAPAYVTSAGGPGSYTGLPWDVNFTTTAAQNAQGSFVDLTVGLASTEANLTVALNGHSLTWTTGTSNTDAMTRSGDAGVYQMVGFEWPVADLVAAGSQDQFAFTVNTTDGDMYDALRMEISSTGAAPGVTGWRDYSYVTSSGQITADNVLPTDPSTWNLNSVGSWATSGNWLFGVPNAVGATAYLASNPGITAASSIVLAGNQTLGALIFNNTVGGTSNSYTISQSNGVGSLTFDNGSAQALIDNEAGNHLIAVPITLNSDLSASVATSTNTLTISGAIGGAHRLLVSGAGAVMLSGNNTYTGDTAVNSGTLNLASAGHVVSTNIFVAAGATFLDAGTVSTSTNLTDNGTTTITTASPTIATLNGSGTLNLNSSAILSISSGGSFSGVVAGNGGLTVSGGALKLSGANTYTGSTNVTAGSLELVSPGALATNRIATTNGASFTIDSGATIASTTSLSVAGTTTLKSSAVTVSGFGGEGTGVLNLTSTAFTVTFGGSYGGTIAGTGSLTLSSGSLTLSGIETYSGATTVSNGSLQISTGGALASTNVSISSNGSLTIISVPALSSTTTLTDNGKIDLGGTTQTISTLNGSGTLTLDKFTSTAVDLTVTAGGTFSGPMNGTGTLTIAGGTLNLTGPLAASIGLVSNGTTNFAANAGTAGPAALTMASLNIGAVGAVTINSSLLHANRTVVEVGSLAFAGTPAAPSGLLDLKDNDLIVHNGSLSDITNEIAAAFNNGAWNGSGGITSSVASTAKITTLAAVLNDDGTGTDTALFNSFDGQSVVDGDVLVKYTLYGDAEL